MSSVSVDLSLTRGADFFLAAVVTPVTADLAASAREMEGIGCK